jgi:glycosyltransferase 2 family protein
MQHVREYWTLIQTRIPPKTMRHIIYAGIVVVSLGFIGYAVIKNWSELQSQKWNVNYAYILLSLLVYPAGFLPTTVAWHMLLKAFGVHKPYLTNLRLYAQSSLPRHIPGFVVFVTSRSMLYKQENVPNVLTAVATGIETLLLAITGFITSLILMTIGFREVPFLANWTWILLPAALILLGLLLWPRTFEILFHKAMKRWGKSDIQPYRQKDLVKSLVWMFIAWAGGGLILFVLAQAITPLPWTRLPVFIGIWGAAGAVSLTIGIGIQGFGIREVTLGALLSTFLPPIQAFALAVAFRLILTLGELIWVIFAIWITRSTSPSRKGAPN